MLHRAFPAAGGSSNGFSSSPSRADNGSKPLPVLLRGHARESLEQSAEEGEILVPDRTTHLVHGLDLTLQHLACFVDAQLVQVFQRRIPDGRLEPAVEVPWSHPGLRREIAKRDVPAEVV